MGRVRSKHDKMINAHTFSVGKHNGKNHLRDLRVDQWKILKLVLSIKTLRI